MITFVRCTLCAQGNVTPPKAPQAGKPTPKPEVEETIYEISTNDDWKPVDNRTYPEPPDPIVRTHALSKFEEVRKQYADESKPRYLEWMKRGNPDGLAGIKQGLKSTDYNLNLKTLEFFETLFPDTALTFDTETFDLVLRFLQDTGKCQLPALKALAFVAPARASGPLMAFIQDKQVNASARNRAVSCLSFTTPQANSIQFLGKLFNQKPNSEQEDFTEMALYALTQMHLAGTDADRKQIETILKPAFLKPSSFQDDMESAIYELAKHPSREMLPIFEKYQDHHREGRYAKEAIAQIQGSDARPMVERLLADDKQFFLGLQLIHWAWKDAPQEGLAFVQRLYGQNPELHAEFFVYASWKIGGADLAKQFISTLPDTANGTRCEAFLREMYLPIDAQHSLWLKSQALYKAGFLAEPYSFAELERIRDAGDSGLEFDLSATLLRSLPSYADVDRFHDDYLPLNHVVIHGFLPALGDRLKGIECYHHRKQLDFDVFEYSLWLIYNETMYSVRDMPIKYSISIRSIAELLNALLQDAKIAERFKPVNVHGATHYMFILPEQVPLLESILN